MLKRGVSPLIATVLLIAFAVALGAVVMSWGQNYVKETTSTGSSGQKQFTCLQNVNIVVSDAGEVCYNSSTNKVEFFLENRGVQVDNVKVTLIGADDVVSSSNVFSTPGPITQAEIRKGTIDMEAISSVKQVIITPFITIHGEETPCTDNAIRVNSPPACK